MRRGLIRSLTHYRRQHLAVAAGAAVATAVLTGALVVGDSVRASLARVAGERLGRIEWALAAPGWVGEGLAGRLGPSATSGVGATGGRPSPVRFGEVVPAVALRGAAVHPGSGARAARVDVWGVDGRFAGLFPAGGEALAAGLARAPGQLFPSLVVNETLARELGAAAGDAVVLSFTRPDEVPAESLLGERDPAAAAEALRLTVTAVLPDSGAGRFGLAPHQGVPRLAYVPLANLQRALEAPGKVNALLVAGGGAGGPEATALASALAAGLELGDLALTVRARGEVVALESREYVLRPAFVEAALEAAGGAPVAPVIAYLANSIALGERAIPYSTVAALPSDLPPVFGGLRLAGGAPAPRLGPEEILLDDWTAGELAARPGDRVEMAFYVVGRDDRLETATASFTVAGILAKEGLAADPTLTPEVPGLTDSADMSAWDPPFPVDLARVRPVDEEYWDRHRGAPKAFVAPETARRLWASRFGETTSLRVATARGEDPEAAAGAFGRRLLAALDPAAAGLAFQPVRSRGQAASSGATDFSGLFVGFSLFLIAAAALLVGLLFALGVERRAAEIGLLRAVGTPRASVARRLLAEGLTVAAAGTAAGTALAVGYAAAVLAALGAWWRPVAAPGLLRLAVEPATLIAGSAASLALVVAVVVLTLRRLGRLPTVALLRGETEVEAGPRTGRGARRTAVATLLVAAGLAAAALAGEEVSAGLFFGVGAALCTAGVAAFAAWSRTPRGGLAKRVAAGGAGTAALAAGSAGRHPGRSLLAVALTASATFVLVAVAANRRDFGRAAEDRTSGAGGFALVAESDVPLRAPLDRPEGRAELGFAPDDEAALAGLAAHPFRLRPGEDASCLNLYRPERPRLLGATPAFLERGGFRFRQAASEVDNPWTLLDDDLGPGVIPAIGDHNSVRWILQAGLGDDLAIADDRGAPLRLRIVGTLETSLFQSELIVSERAFLAHFPDHGGYRFFLLDPPAGGDPAEVSRRLEAGLARFGFDATSTAARLAGFQEVEDMYLTTFQALGGLGLLLGTIGLAVVMVRNVLERRRELAALAAFGFARRRLAALIVAESAFLLATGLAIGTLSALAAVAPHLAAGGIRPPWLSLAATLAAVLAAGLAASLLAARTAARAPLLPALKAE